MRITTPGVPDTMERKRLGQFFTGTRLAQALAALADASSARSIIDPMSGTGDMLIGCSESGARPTRVGAIEIDPPPPPPAVLVPNDSESYHIETGSAFDPDSWVALPGGWDLVITNPPYVRYQTGSSAASGRVSVPAAETIRHGLVRVISASTTLSDKELSAFRAAAENYSGLSDLAVPSWLLCAAKVKLGGRLALVVPDTWLSRDYAVPVVYVLRRFFEIECVVIDEDAAWFEDALVRTTLVVARRVEEKGSAIGKSGHLVIQVPASAGDETSCVGRVFPAKDANLAFADWVVERRQTKEPSTQPLVSDWSDELDLVGGLIVAAERRTWIALSAEDAFSQQLHRLPGRVRAVLPQNFRASFADLAGLGWATGQGLRSGANDFFYVKIQMGRNVPLRSPPRRGSHPSRGCCTTRCTTSGRSSYGRRPCRDGPVVGRAHPRRMGAPGGHREVRHVDWMAMHGGRPCSARPGRRQKLAIAAPNLRCRCRNCPRSGRTYDSHGVPITRSGSGTIFLLSPPGTSPMCTSHGLTLTRQSHT